MKQSIRGFIQIPLLLMMVSMLALGACATTSGTQPTPAAATETPLQKAGKSLLAAKSTIVTAATATDGLCKAGTITPATCAEAKTAYDQARLAYDSAVDAYLLTAQGYGDPAALDAAIGRLQTIALRLLALAGGTRPLPDPPPLGEGTKVSPQRGEVGGGKP